jgi:catechol 2,3-dioxygenase-like lactoylglutathione lyase family enzyme
MKTSIDQYCINVTDLAKSVHFHEEVLGLTVTHQVETPDFKEVILAGENGHRIQLACHRAQKGPIDHGNGFWKLYLDTDGCKGLYPRCIDAGAESISAPERLRTLARDRSIRTGPGRVYGRNSRDSRRDPRDQRPRSELGAA